MKISDKMIGVEKRNNIESPQVGKIDETINFEKSNNGEMIALEGREAARREFYIRESIVVFSFDPTWLVLTVGTPNHGSRTGLWVSCWR